MVAEDLDEVMKIEEASFSSPWSRGMFLTELKDNPFSTLLVARLGLPSDIAQLKSEDQALSVRARGVGDTCLPAGRSEDEPLVLPHGPPHRIVGYCCFWIVFGEVHIMNLAVHPDYRRKGIATRLVEVVTSISRHEMVQMVHLEVRKSNEFARKLYEKFGFRVIGVRPNYYTHPREDALLMVLELGPASGLTSGPGVKASEHPTQADCSDPHRSDD
jgi:ribosomal-protein-alanine N-acetyltransferase